MCESDQMYLRRRGVCVLFFSPVSHLQSLGEQLCVSESQCGGDFARSGDHHQ